MCKQFNPTSVGVENRSYHFPIEKTKFFGQIFFIFLKFILNQEKSRSFGSIRSKMKLQECFLQGGVLKSPPSLVGLKFHQRGCLYDKNRWYRVSQKMYVLKKTKCSETVFLDTLYIGKYCRNFPPFSPKNKCPKTSIFQLSAFAHS